jgi:predicted Zn-dependent peptidase
VIRLLGVVLATMLSLTATPAAPAAGVAVTREVLPNGMTVIAREDPAVGVVAVSLQVRAGSLFESEPTAGITNFVQRMLLRGTAQRSARELAETAEELGGSLEASGDVEFAEVRAAAIARQWRPLIALVAEVVLEPSFPAAEIERERRLLLGQLQTRADNPFPRVVDTALREVYGAHPYAWPALGRTESVAQLTREALVAHYRAVYRPDRMVLAVSGNVPRADVMAAAERLFRRLPAPGGAPASPAIAPRPLGDRRVVERDARQAQVLVGFLAPPLAHPDYAPVRVLATVLGGGMSSRLFVELRDRRGLAYSVGVLATARTGPALFAPYLGTAPPNADAALAGVFGEVDRLRTEPIAERELARAKAYIAGTLAMDRRTSARQAWHLAFYELIGAGWDWPRRFVQAVEAVTAEDVLRVAQHYLVQPTVVMLRPPAGAVR